MNKEFVTHDIAVRLYEKGFDEPCIAHYTSTGGFRCSYYGYPDDPEKEFTSYRNSEIHIDGWVMAPLYQQVLDWFRKKHYMHVHITMDPDVYHSILNYYGETLSTELEKEGICLLRLNRPTGQSYDQALDQIIHRTLDLIKNGQV